MVELQDRFSSTYVTSVNIDPAQLLPQIGEGFKKKRRRSLTPSRARRSRAADGRNRSERPLSAWGFKSFVPKKPPDFGELREAELRDSAFSEPGACTLPVYSQYSQYPGSHVTQQAQCLLTSQGTDLRITFFICFVGSAFFIYLI